MNAELPNASTCEVQRPKLTPDDFLDTVNGNEARASRLLFLVKELDLLMAGDESARRVLDCAMGDQSMYQVMRHYYMPGRILTK